MSRQATAGLSRGSLPLLLRLGRGSSPGHTGKRHSDRETAGLGCFAERSQGYAEARLVRSLRRRLEWFGWRHAHVEVFTPQFKLEAVTFVKERGISVVHAGVITEK